MRAIVIDVNTDAKVKHYDVTALKVQTEKGEEKTYNFFKNTPCINKVNRLQKGQNIEIKMEKNGKFWNPVDVDVVEEAPKTTSSFGNSQDEFRRSKEEMRRGEALAAAIHFIEMNKPKKEILIADVVAVAMNFEDYLANGGNVNEEVADLLDT